MSLRHNLLATAAASTLIACAFTGIAHANPLDGTVSAGAADITSTGKTLDIIQHSDKAIIDWRGFDIDADETTNIYQPGSGSILVNRVHSTSASQINGRLNANGNVIIINQNGIMFGAGAVVDVHGLVATTSDTDNNRFMNETKVHLDLPGGAGASIINNGTITAHDAGLVGFVAPNVVNNGTITANLGRVHLAGGDKATVDFYGDGLLEVQASDSLQNVIVTQTGNITADGGKIALTAAAGGQVVNSIINAQGVIRAQSVSVHNGEIIIGAGKTGRSRVNVAGSLDASSSVGTGGKVTVTGDHIAIKNTASINASGLSGGGVIKVGGDVHGVGPTQTAQTVSVEHGAYIVNNAISFGNGGETIVWADGYTSFEGLIEGRGGALGGNGGFVEVSGKDVLHYDGLVDLAAADGYEYGTLLLDPADITISSGTNAGGTFSGGVYTPSGSTSVINTGTLLTQLGSANVTINTSAGSGGLGDITFANAFSWSLTNKTLTLIADRDIIFNAAVTGTTVNTGLVATATRDIKINANLAVAGNGVMNLTAGRDLTIASGQTVSGSNSGTMSLKAAGGIIGNQGLLTIGGTINAGGGGLVLVTGLDATNARTQDLTLTSAKLTYSGATAGAVSITGFRDVAINTLLKSSGTIAITPLQDFSNTGAITTTSTSSSAVNITATRDVTFGANITTGTGNGSITAQAGRNLSVGTGVTLSTGSTGGVSLKAAGGLIGSQGLLSILGTVNAGGGAFTLLTGLDGSSARTQDLALTSSRLTYAGTTLGNVSITGYRDVAVNTALASSGTITITPLQDFSNSGAISTTGASGINITASRNMTLGANITGGTGNSSVTIQAGRNLTVNSSVAVSSGSTGGVSLKAAGGLVTSQGLLDFKGTISTGTGTLTMLSGLNASDVSVQDLTLNATNLLMPGGNIASASITGFRDVTIATPITAVNGIIVSNSRDFTNTAALTTTTGSGNTTFTAGRDILMSANITRGGTNNSIAVQAGRDLTVSSGVTLTPGGTGGVSLKAAGGSTTGYGVLRFLGGINVGTGAVTLLSGADETTGVRTNLTLNGTNFIPSTGKFGALSISGFNDITLANNLDMLQGSSFVAEHDLTVNNGVTLTMSGASPAALLLRAAGGVATNHGQLKLNGDIVLANSIGLNLFSGLDTSDNASDIIVNDDLFTLSGSVIGALALQGFRDITLAKNLTFGNVSSTITWIAERNLTINNGVHINLPPANHSTMRAGGATSSNIGSLSFDGTMTIGNGNLILSTGLEASGLRTKDIVLDNNNVSFVTPFMQALTITGYRDVTLGTSFYAGAGVTVTADRNITVNNGVTLRTGNSNGISLKAASATGSSLGVLRMNGILDVTANAAITLVTGYDSDGVRPDLTLNSTNLLYAGNAGLLTVTGFRDVVLDRAWIGTGITIGAQGNLTVTANAPITTTTGNTVLSAGASGAGVLNFGSSLNVTGAGNVTLSSGAGNRTNLVLDNSNFTTAGTIGALTVRGFNDITLNRNITTADSIEIAAERKLTIGQGTVLTSGGNVTLAGLNVINNAGANAINTSAGRWLIYANDSTTSQMGDLPYAFRTFSCAYGAACAALPVTGNGYVFSNDRVNEILAEYRVNSPLPASVVTFKYSAPQTVTQPSTGPSDMAATNVNGASNSNPYVGAYRQAAPMLTFAPELVNQFKLQNWSF